VAKILEPFEIESAPEVRVRGHFEGPAPGSKRHFDFGIEAETSGRFRFHHFPLQDVSFAAQFRDDEIIVERVDAGFAGGTTSGHARVWGEGDARRVGFDYSLKGASLGQAASALEEFMSHQRGRAPAPPGKFVQEKANVRIDLAASAEGRYADALSYRGQGSAVLEGAEIGEVPLLGALSELLKFTALRFTSARANFKIDGPKLIFPEIALRGANSGIDAHGDYALDRHELDFKAKIFPFQESGSIIKSVVGAVLTPFSNVFEVKLSGSLEKPAWGLAAFAGEKPPEERRPEPEPAAKPGAGTPVAAPPSAPENRERAARAPTS
ncbi:MAG TPA: AsmA-like C-terminal region-containing protein, partial [Opitutaceae bacterium]|nr:AsmA-like C-terminal region-containing protein [Opitutaceae bacterium]